MKKKYKTGKFMFAEMKIAWNSMQFGKYKIN